MFFSFLFKNILSISIKNFHAKFTFSLFKSLSLRLHKIKFLKGYLYFKSINSNIIVRDILQATLSFSSKVFLNYFYLINELLVLIVITLFLLFYDIKVFIILFITVLPFFLIFYRWARKKNVRINNQRKVVQPLVMKNIYQSIYGYVDVIVTDSEKLFRNKIKGNLSTLSNLNRKSIVYNLIPSKVVETSIILAVVILISSGLYFFDTKDQLLQLIAVFIVASYKIIPSINKISISMNILSQNYWVFDSLSPLIDNPSIDYSKKTKKFSFKRELKLESIYFKYPGQTNYVLQDFSLTIKKGDVVGFIGPSGSGKTTIINILLRFLKPSSGLFSVDNNPISNFSLSSLSKSRLCTAACLFG